MGTKIRNVAVFLAVRAILCDLWRKFRFIAGQEVGTMCDHWEWIFHGLSGQRYEFQHGERKW